jgi:acyl-CoA thioesterase
VPIPKQAGAKDPVTAERRPTAELELRYVTDETSQAQKLAVAVADFLLAHDKAACGLGISVFRVGIGSAIMKMTVRSDMLNAFDICHGGVVTALADTAFAVACNSYDQLAVASCISVDFTRPAREGDCLTATATEVATTGRTGLYDVEVTNQDGLTVAVFRGRSARISGRTVLPKKQQ